MPYDLTNNVAIVTGSSRGIGRGIAERLAAEGARVVVNGRQQETIEPVAQALRDKGGQAIAVAGDVGLAADVDRLFEETVRAFGGVDTLVNNAAWASPNAHFLEMDEDHWDTVIHTNLSSVYLCCSHAARLMVDQRRPGSIINISSFAAARAHRQMAAYDATKGGMEAFTRAIAIDLAPFGVRANVVGPGAIHTEEYEPDGEEGKRRRGQTVRSVALAIPPISPAQSRFWPRTTPAISPARCCTSMAACSRNCARRRSTRPAAERRRQARPM